MHHVPATTGLRGRPRLDRERGREWLVAEEWEAFLNRPTVKRRS